jgi:hypothetical protein
VTGSETMDGATTTSGLLFRDWDHSRLSFARVVCRGFFSKLGRSRSALSKPSSSSTFSP